MGTFFNIDSSLELIYAQMNCLFFWWISILILYLFLYKKNMDCDLIMLW